MKFRQADNLFEGIASQDAAVEFSGQLNVLAVALSDRSDCVPLTTRPRRRACSTSIAAFHIAVVTISRRRGSASISAASSGVRSRIRQTASNDCSRATRSARA